MAEVRLKVVLDGVEQTVTTVNQLEAALQNTKTALADLDVGSAQFKELQQQARNIDSELKNIQKSTEGVDTAQLAGSFAKLGESVVGGFAIATSAAKLFGKESEDLTKAQVQAQETLNIVLGARAIAEGVVEGAAAARLIVDKVSVITTGALTAAFGKQTVVLAQQAVAAGTATTAQTALNTAMKLSPIGLLITAIGSLIVFWDDLTEAIGLSNDAVDEYNEKQKKTSDDLDKELTKTLAQTVIKYNELENAINNTTDAAQDSWIKVALKDLPELINLTGEEADAVEKVGIALRKRSDIEQAEAKRARNLKELVELEEEMIKKTDLTIEENRVILTQQFTRINYLREQNKQLDQQIGQSKALLDAEIKREADKKKAAEDAAKAAQDAYNRRIEQIKNERNEIRELLKTIKTDTTKNNQDILLEEREISASRIKNQFDREQAILNVAKDRQTQELEAQKKAALDQVDATIIGEKEKTKAREVINKQFTERQTALDEQIARRSVEIEQQRADQIKKVNEALITELNYGDSQFADTKNARALQNSQFENELAQRQLTETTLVDRLTITEKVKYYNELAGLQLKALDIERQQRITANESQFKQESQLAKDRFELGEITADQLKTIEDNLNTLRVQENEKVEKDIAQKRIAINAQTEQQILAAKIAGIQQYLQFATQGIQALSQVSQTIEQAQLNRVTEANQTELDSNLNKNQQILDQELTRINQTNATEVEKQKMRDDAIKKSQDQKAKDDKKTEEKIEKQRNEIRKKAFARTKALNIATALVNGAQAVLQAIAQFGPPPSPLGIAGIAAAGVLTAAQVAAIASQQYQEEGGGAKDLNVPETSTTVGGETPSTTPAGGFTLFNPDLVNVPTQGTRGGAGVGPTGERLRVYVLESDITQTQQRVRTTVEQASFG